MKTVVKADEVAHLWAHQAQGEARTPTGNLFFTGKTIYSYGSHFPIASFVEYKGKTAVLFTTRTYSVTTAGHCSTVHAAMHHIKPVFHVSHVGQGHWKDNVSGYADGIKELTEKVARARTNRDWLFSRLVELVEEANAYCEFFDLPDRFSVPEDFETLRASLSKVAAEKAKVEKERKRKLAQSNAEKIERWKAGDSVTLPSGLDTYLRIEGSELVTSLGARIPVSHARIGLMAVRRVLATGEPYKRNGHTIHLGHYPLDSIDLKGNVQAGCHFVPYAEIERIAPLIEGAAK